MKRKIKTLILIILAFIICQPYKIKAASVSTEYACSYTFKDNGKMGRFTLETTEQNSMYFSIVKSNLPMSIGDTSGIYLLDDYSCPQSITMYKNSSSKYELYYGLTTCQKKHSTGCFTTEKLQNSNMTPQILSRTCYYTTNYWGAPKEFSLKTSGESSFFKTASGSLPTTVIDTITIGPNKTCPTGIAIYKNSTTNKYEIYHSLSSCKSRNNNSINCTDEITEKSKYSTTTPSDNSGGNNNSNDNSNDNQITTTPGTTSTTPSTPDNSQNNNSNENTQYVPPESGSFNGPTEADWGNVTNTNLKKICNQPSYRKITKIIGSIVQLVKILIPLIVIIFGLIDLYKAITSSKSEEINASIKSIIIKIVAGIFVFLLPGIVQTILNLVNEYSDYKNTWCCCTQCILDASSCSTDSCSSKSCKIGGMN